MDDADVLPWLSLADLPSKFVSYAQNGEDARLARVFPHGGGFYVDVGANDPVFHSVTKHFSDRGWSGVNVEPHPTLFARLAAARPRDVNLHAGLSDVEGTLTFHEVPDGRHGWSTFDRETARKVEARGAAVIERDVPVTTLARVCERHVGDRTIDFLKIDVENHEHAVLKGADWSRWRPRVVVIEAVWPELYEAWEPLLMGADYLMAAFDGLNRYYVRAEDRDLAPALATGINVLDNVLPYEVLRLIDALREERQRAVEGVGPTAMALARRLQRLAGRHPRLAGAAGRLLRRRRRAG